MDGNFFCNMLINHVLYMHHISLIPQSIGRYVYCSCFLFVGSAGNEKNNEGLFSFFHLIRLFVWMCS